MEPFVIKLSMHENMRRQINVQFWKVATLPLWSLTISYLVGASLSSEKNVF